MGVPNTADEITETSFSERNFFVVAKTRSDFGHVTPECYERQLELLSKCP